MQQKKQQKQGKRQEWKDQMKESDRMLKAFGKTKLLKPGESEILTMNFTDYDLAHFDEPSSSWVLEKGLYKVSFGASCEDIRSVRDIKVKKQQRWGVNRVLNPVVPVQTMTID